MKKLIFLVLILISFCASAQRLPGTQNDDVRRSSVGMHFLTLKAPKYASTANYPIWLPNVGADIMIDTLAPGAGIWIRFGTPPVWHQVTSDTLPTGGGGGGTLPGIDSLTLDPSCFEIRNDTLFIICGGSGGGSVTAGDGIGVAGSTVSVNSTVARRNAANNYTPVLTATANDQDLIAQNINPTYNNGAFSNIRHLAAKYFGDIDFAADATIYRNGTPVIYFSDAETKVMNYNGELRLVTGYGGDQMRILGNQETIFSNTNYDASFSSALVEMRSTTKAFLPPRMTYAQMIAISVPAEGMLVHVNDSSPGLYSYISSAWVKVGATVALTVDSSGSNVNIAGSTLHIPTAASDRRGVLSPPDFNDFASRFKLAEFSAAANSNGVSKAGFTLYIHKATDYTPGYLSADAQDIGGEKTFFSLNDAGNPTVSGARSTPYADGRGTLKRGQYIPAAPLITNATGYDIPVRARSDSAYAHIPFDSTVLNFLGPLIKSGRNISLNGYANGDNVVYGQVTAGVPGMIKTALVDTTNRQTWDSSQMVFDKATQTHKYSPKIGSYVAPKLLQLIVGVTPAAPAAGDSLFTQSSFIGKFVTIQRDGIEQYYNSTLPGSYQFNTGAGTITTHPPLALNEKIKIYITASPPDTLSIDAPWTFMTFSSSPAPNNVQNISNVYTPTTSGLSGWFGYSVMNETFTGNQAVRIQHKSDAQSYIVGLRDDNAQSDFMNYDVGFYVQAGGTVWKVESGTPSAISGGVTVSNDEYISIYRVGSTFKLRTSTDGTTWTDRYTYTYTSSATHYTNLNLFTDNPLGKAYYLQIK